MQLLKEDASTRLLTSAVKRELSFSELIRVDLCIVNPKIEMTIQLRLALSRHQYNVDGGKKDKESRSYGIIWRE